MKNTATIVLAINLETGTATNAVSLLHLAVAQLVNQIRLADQGASKGNKLHTGIHDPAGTIKRIDTAFL